MKCSVVLPIASEVPATTKRDKTYALDKKTTTGKTTSTKPVLFPAAIRHLFHLPVPGSSSPEEHHKDTIHSRAEQSRNDEKIAKRIYLLF